MDDAVVLTERDLHICNALVVWIEVAQHEAKKAGLQGTFGFYEALPSSVDIEKSRLFWRLRSGKLPLSSPPPRAFSCPWYEVVEEEGPHYCFEVWRDKEFEPDGIVINQCPYTVTQVVQEGAEYYVSFGPWHFHLWKTEDAESVKKYGRAWAIKRVPVEGEDLYATVRQ